MKTTHIAAIAVTIAIGILAYQASKYEIDDNHQAVIIKFKKVVNVQTEPGTYYKIPLFHKVHYYKKTSVITNNAEKLITIDKKYLLFKSDVFWRITDLLQYYKAIFKYEHGQYRVLDVVKSAERDIIAQHYMEDIVQEKEFTSIKDAQCKPDITKKMSDFSNPYLIKLGIELISIEATITYPIN